MTLPTNADVHVNEVLTDMSVAYQQELTDYKADDLAPIHASPKQSNTFFKFTKDFWFRDAMQKRGPGAQAPRVGYGLATDSYAIDVWSAAKAIDDQVRANEDAPLNSDRDAMMFVTRLERLRREKSFAATCLTTSVWGTDVTGNTSASAYGSNTVAQWDDDNASPLEDIAHYKSVVKLATGLEPNVLAIGRQVWDKLKNNADIIARISGGSNNGSPAQVTRQVVAALMELDELVVLDAVENTAAEGATFAGSYIAGKKGLLMHRNPNAGVMSVTAVKTFCWQRLSGAANGTRVLTYQDGPHLDIVEIESAFAHKIVAPDLGVFFNTLVA